MALTLEFKESIQAQMRADPPVPRRAPARGGEHMLSGDIEFGKAVLRNYVEATVGYEQLGATTGASAKSLIRKFGPLGNPQARNLFPVIRHLQREAGFTRHVTAQPQ